MIFHWIKSRKWIWNPCCHLVAEPGGWLILIFDMYHFNTQNYNIKTVLVIYNQSCTIKGVITISRTTLSSVGLFVTLSITVLSAIMLIVICWVSQIVLLCWASLCWVSLCKVSLYWVSWCCIKTHLLQLVPSKRRKTIDMWKTYIECSRSIFKCLRAFFDYL